MNLVVHLNESVIPCLEFSLEFQSNKLIYQKEYTKWQQIIYVLIQYLHDREVWRFKAMSFLLPQVLSFKSRAFFKERMMPKWIGPPNSVVNWPVRKVYMVCNVMC